MEARTLKSECEAAGWCCELAFLKINEATLRSKGKYLTGRFFGRTFDFTDRGGWRIIRRFKDGHYKCAHKTRCMLAAAGIDTGPEPEPEPVDPNVMSWRALKGKHFGVYHTEPVIARKGDPIQGSIVSQSLTENLWLTVSMVRLDLTIKLGDILFLDAFTYGTVVDIDGPLVTILLPGARHGQRNKVLLNHKGQNK